MPIIWPDLIPQTSWGSSLPNLLVWPSWDRIRQPMIRWAGGCQICAAEQGKPLDCHEVWAYSMPPPKAPKRTVGVQRLMALAVLCADCHSMFHLGYALSHGTFPAVKQRLMEFNQWSEAEFQSYASQQDNVGTARDKWRWVLDVSLVQKAGPLVVKTGSGGWSYHEENGGYLTAPSKYSNEDSFTAILGASFEVGSRVVDAIDATEARSGLLPEQGDFAFAQWVRKRRIQR